LLVISRTCCPPLVTRNFRGRTIWVQGVNVWTFLINVLVEMAINPRF
jgi:hypothetical protein